MKLAIAPPLSRSFSTSDDRNARSTIVAYYPQKMLLNPSHAITSSGLPDDILDTYVRYKKGTRAILKWLRQHAPVETRAAYPEKTLPIRDLAKLAQVASKHISCMPEVVHFHFRETIQARTALSKYFRNQSCGGLTDSKTLEHEHFTSSLADIYASLSECCGESSDHFRWPLNGNKQKNESLSNKFTYLFVEDCSCSDEENEPISSVSRENCDTKNAAPSCLSTDPELRLLGDELSDAIETMAIVRQIHELYQESRSIWRQVGAGGVSLIIASAVTNVALASLRELEAQLQELDPSVDLPSLHKTCGVPPSMEYEIGSRGETQHQMLRDMHNSWKIVMRVKARPLVPSGAACIHKPTEFLNSAELVKMLTQGILHLMSSEAVPDAVILNGSPTCSEMADLLIKAEDSSTKLRFVLSLHLLSTSYQAYKLGLESFSMLPSCRLSALKLSQQAEFSLSTILSDNIAFPCRCTETISFHLELLMQNLQKYTAHKCWDIFFQAPWVAGNHILEMVDMFFYYGMRLLQYRHYVGSILHVYNVLKQLAGMEEVHLLEELCNKFATVFFPVRQRPTNSFSANWARFVGARLKFKNGHKGHDHRESWCLTIPSHAAERAAGFGIGSDGKSHLAADVGISRITDLKRMDYHVDESTWKNIEASHRGRKGSIASRPGESKFFPGHSTTDGRRLHNLSSYLANEMRGSLPIFRLNLFAVFHTCIRIVSSISNTTHIDHQGKELRCLCFASTILAGGDRIKDNGALGRPDCWKKLNGERDVVEAAKKAIREVMAGVEEKDWLWNV